MPRFKSESVCPSNADYAVNDTVVQGFIVSPFVNGLILLIFGFAGLRVMCLSCLYVAYLTRRETSVGQSLQVLGM